jgi:hypothetical protein
MADQTDQNPGEKDAEGNAARESVEGHALQHKRDINDADGGDVLESPSDDAEAHALRGLKRDINDASGGDPLEDIEGHAFTWGKHDANAADGGDPLAGPDRDAV